MFRSSSAVWSVLDFGHGLGLQRNVQMVLTGSRFLRPWEHVGWWTAKQFSSRRTLHRPLADQQHFEQQQDIIFSAMHRQKPLHLWGKIENFTPYEVVRSSKIFFPINAHRVENPGQLEAGACKMNVKISGASAQVWNVFFYSYGCCDNVILAELNAILIDNTPLTYRTKVNLN